MNIEVLNGDEGWLRVEPLDREVYPPEVMATVPWRDVVWAHADLRVIVSDREGIRCHVGVLWRNGTFDGQRVRMAGIGGVMTSPGVRRKGYASEVLRRAEEFMVHEQVDFGLLFCEPHNERFVELSVGLFSPAKFGLSSRRGAYVST